MACILLHQTWQIYPPNQAWMPWILPWYSSYRQINWQIYPPYHASSGQEWQLQICIVKADIGRWTGRSNPSRSASSSEWSFLVSIVKAHADRSTGRSTPWYWHLVVKNSNWQIHPRSASRSTPQCNASWDIYYGMYLVAILDSRKGGNFLLFLNI